MDKNFEVKAKRFELFVDDDQESIICFGGDVRTETDHTSEALGPQAQDGHDNLYGLDPVDGLFGEFLNKLIDARHVASHPRDAFRFFAVGPRYASWSGSGNTGADAPDDSETLLFEQLCGFSGSKRLFDDLTPPLTLIDGMGDGLDHRLGTAKVLLVAVGIGGGFDDSM